MRWCEGYSVGHWFMPAPSVEEATLRPVLPPFQDLHCWSVISRFQCYGLQTIFKDRSLKNKNCLIITKAQVEREINSSLQIIVFHDVFHSENVRTCSFINMKTFLVKKHLLEMLRKLLKIWPCILFDTKTPGTRNYIEKTSRPAFGSSWTVRSVLSPSAIFILVFKKK